MPSSSNTPDDEETVVLLEPGRTFENLSATTALAGKNIQWSTTTKDKILVFCARKGIAAGALDADVVIALMTEIRFDAKDTQVYEALLKKLLGYIKNNINVKNLDPFLEVTKVGSGTETQAACIVRYARCAADWANKTDILKNLDRVTILQSLGHHDSMDMGPAVRREWLSPALCIDKVMAHRKSSSSFTMKKSPRAAVPSDHEAEAMNTFLACLSSGFGMDQSSLSHRMLFSPELLAKSLVSWAAAGATEKKRAESLAEDVVALEGQIGCLERSLQDANDRMEAMKVDELKERARKFTNAPTSGHWAESPRSQRVRHDLESVYSDYPEPGFSRNTARSRRRGNPDSFFDHADPAEAGHESTDEDIEPFQARREKARSTGTASAARGSCKARSRFSGLNLDTDEIDGDGPPAVLSPPRSSRSRRPMTRSQTRGQEVQFVDL